jgi:hypothetical protein
VGLLARAVFWFGVNAAETRTVAVAGSPAAVPPTVNVPGAAYAAGSTASHVTGTDCVTPSV